MLSGNGRMQRDAMNPWGKLLFWCFVLEKIAKLWHFASILCASSQYLEEYDIVIQKKTATKLYCRIHQVV